MKPRIERRLSFETIRGKKLLVLRRQSGEAYHCVCGDRFGSAPPHGKALAIGLHATVV